MTDTPDPTASTAGDCPRCNSFDDDLSARDGICETCWREDQGLSVG